MCFDRFRVLPRQFEAPLSRQVGFDLIQCVDILQFCALSKQFLSSVLIVPEFGLGTQMIEFREAFSL